MAARGLKQNDVVKVVWMDAAPITRDAWRVNTRKPRPGDVGVVIEVLEEHGRGSRYVVECVDGKGAVLWLSDFRLDELELDASRSSLKAFWRDLKAGTSRTLAAVTGKLR